MILEVDSLYDNATVYGAVFRAAKYVLPYFQKRPYMIKHLWADSAIPTNFREEVNKKEICFISGFDHGGSDTFYGQGKSRLWDSEAGIQENEVQGKVIHLLACQCGKNLGVELVQKGAKAFFGYSENFIFTTDPGADIVLSDVVADPFFKADSEIDRGLADGLTADEVHKEVIRLYNDLIDDWMGRSDRVAAFLNHDLNCLCSPTKDRKWGDKNAAIDNALRVFNFLAQCVLFEISRP